MESLPPSSSDDALLLRCWVRESSEAAFRALAGRHLPLVWSTARRLVQGDEALARDIAQSVLADFALKAAALPPDMPPAGWLHRHTVFTASKTLRSESRRRARERAAVPPPDAMTAPDNTWSELAPHLDEALDRLRESDRQAILLRFYEDRPLREIARALGATEEAARKRIERALGKLRGLLRRRGLAPALGVLALLLQENSTAAPPAAILRSVTQAAWARVEGGALPTAAALPWWRRRRVVARAAAAALTILAVLLWRGGFLGPDPPHRLPAALALTAPHAAARGAEEDFPPVTLTATLMMLPEQDVAGIMLDYTPGRDDAALYQQLLPRAAALQKSVKPEQTFATTGHALVVLSGESRPSRTAFLDPPPEPVPGDPFGDPLAGRTPSVSLRRIAKYEYPTEFDPPDAQGRIERGAFSFRNMGTSLDAFVSPPDADGNILFTGLLDHQVAPPEEEEFLSLPLKDGTAPEDGNAMYTPVFRSTQWSLGPLTVPQNAVMLAGMMHLPPEVLPEAGRTPHRLLLFLQINP